MLAALYLAFASLVFGGTLVLGFLCKPVLRVATAGAGACAGGGCGAPVVRVVHPSTAGSATAVAAGALAGSDRGWGGVGIALRCPHHGVPPAQHE